VEMNLTRGQKDAITECGSFFFFFLNLNLYSAARTTQHRGGHMCNDVRIMNVR
jgi:hypothetical protein